MYQETSTETVLNKKEIQILISYITVNHKLMISK